MPIDRRVLSRASWACPVGALALACTFVVVADPGRTAIAVFASVVVAGAGLAARSAHDVPWRVTAGVVAVGALFCARTLVSELGGDDRARLAADLGGAIVLFLLVAFMVSRQRGGLRPGDIGDGVIIGVGAWTVAWIVLVQPFADVGGLSTVELALNALLLPTSVLLVSLMATMAFGGAEPSPTAAMLLVGVLLHLVGDLVTAADRVHSFDEWSPTTASLAHLLSMSLVAGAMLHVSAPTLVSATANRRTVALPGRVTVLVASLGAPVLLAVLTPADTPLDRAVRVSSIAALLSMLGFRLVAATHGQDQTRRDLEAAARTDAVTGLPNKRAVLDAVESAVSERSDRSAVPAIYLFDLDGFKNINDSFGHAVGDEVLSVIARRLDAAARAVGATAARVSGDEFAVFDNSPRSVVEATENARAIHLAFQQSLSTTSGELFAKASCGVATLDRRTRATSDDLFRWADIAMYRAKAAGRNRVVVYESEMQDHVSTRMDIENALHGALDRRELHLFHQPIIEIETGRITGLEALLRWRRPDGTIVEPCEFIPIAEETGIIDAIGAWALTESLGQLRRWIDDGTVPDGTTVSVNVSPRQLADPRFAAVVDHAIRTSRIAPHLLWLEVTETMMVENPDVAQSALESIRSTGVRIALDDFGTGFSSLSLLQKFPIQRIKIDRAFIRTIVENVNDRTLVRTIIGLGTSMGIDVVAEGVDTVLQLRLLRELGCAKAQGYLIAQPAPADAMRSTISALDDIATSPEFAEMIGDSPIRQVPRTHD